MNIITHVAGDCSKPPEGTDVLPSQATQHFTSQLGRESNTRNVPPQTLVGTIGSSSSPHQQVNREVKNPEVCVDEQLQKGQSDIVTTQPSLATNGSSDSSSNKIVDILDKVTSLLLSREADMQRKKEKVKVLKERKEEVEGYLTEKNSKIEKMEAEAHTMEVRFAEEKWRRERAQEDLADRENKIKQLQENIYQMDMQLKEEKDNKEEKCAQLQEQLGKAQTSLRSETAGKEKAEAKLEEANKRLKGSQEDVDKVNYEVKTTQKEREKIEHVLEWTQKDLMRAEEGELDWERKRRLGIQYTILFLLAMVFVLTGVLVEVIRRCMSY